jgi:micrococcal nuclease
MGAALIVGFMSAIGWWGGNKVTAAIDGAPLVQDCKLEDLEMYEYAALVTNVVDGDTIDVVVDVGFKIQTRQRLRLARVDTPERSQPNHAEAKRFVEELIGNKLVTVKTQKVSKWGYYLAEVTIDDKNVSDAIIEANLGKPYDGGTKQ